MKRTILIFFVSLLAMTAAAQVKFTVPVPTDLQKYQIATIEWNSSCLMLMNYAKSLGKPVSDVARFTADQLKGTLNYAGGFDGFVHSMLNTMVCLVPYGNVEIVEQTDNEIVYKVTNFFSELKEGGTILNVNYKEYLDFWEIHFSRQAEYLGARYSQKDTDEGLIVTIKRSNAK